MKNWLHKNRIKIPIITYHRVVPAAAKVDNTVINSPFTLSEEQFYQQILFLSQNGYQTINLVHLLNILNGGKNGKEQPNDYNKLIVISFDDGWADNFEYAFPILTSFGFSATFFVITGCINSAEYMSWAQLLEMQQHNMDIESHTHTHFPLELLSATEILWELTHSKNMLEKQLSKQVAFLSFPHGSYNKIVLRAAKQARYLGCGTSNFGYITLSSKLYMLPRILVRKSYDITHFANLCKRHPPTFLKGRLIHKSKSIVKNAIGIERYNNLYKIHYRI